MRSAGGIDVIHKAIDGLSKYHDRHIMLYDPTLVSPPRMCMCVCAIECRVSWGGGGGGLGKALVPPLPPPLLGSWLPPLRVATSHKCMCITCTCKKLNGKSVEIGGFLIFNTNYSSLAHSFCVCTKQDLAKSVVNHQRMVVVYNTTSDVYWVFKSS